MMQTIWLYVSIICKILEKKYEKNVHLLRNSSKKSCFHYWKVDTLSTSSINLLKQYGYYTIFIYRIFKHCRITIFKNGENMMFYHQYWTCNVSETPLRISSILCLIFESTNNACT